MIDHSLELVKVTRTNLSKLEIVLVATLPVLYPASFFKSILKGSNTAYLAVVDGKAVGCVVWRDEEQASHLLALGVFILYRRRGIGSALLNLFIKQCKSKEIYLHVSAESIESITFYQKFGFTSVCRVPNYYRGLVENTAIKMLKVIS